VDPIILAILEILRRWQWNFCEILTLSLLLHPDLPPDRLENEHLGNMDQYRITREVPLPFTVEEVHDDGDESEDANDKASRKGKLRRKRV
jgi:xenotropic and polytropic retrovirus receptor 1